MAHMSSGNEKFITHIPRPGIVNQNNVTRENRARRLAWLQWLGGTEVKVLVCGSGIVRSEFPTISGACKLSYQNARLGGRKRRGRGESYKLSANIRKWRQTLFYNTRCTLPNGVCIFMSFSSVRLFFKFL